MEPVSTGCEADNDLCTIDHCDGNGECVLESEVECEPADLPCDGGAICDPESGECVDQPDGDASTPCDDTDGNACTNAGCDGAGACDQNHMMAPVSTSCDADDSLCTIDHCDGAGECVKLDDVVCQPVVPPCEGGQLCDPESGMCVNQPDGAASEPCQDTDGNACTSAGCDGTGACDQAHVMVPVSTSCNADQDACTIDHCDGAGQCVKLEDVTCQPANLPCEGGQLCDPESGTCVDQPDGAISTSCDADDSMCTMDHCDGNGQCVQRSEVECQPANLPCEGGELCDPQSGECVEQPDGAVSTACDVDDDKCTTDHCDGNGQCVFQENVQCQDPNPPCEGGQLCNPETGQCTDQPDGAVSTPCTPDDDLCTTHHCDGAGECVIESEVVCLEPENECEGGEVCNPDTGMCEIAPDKPVSTPCEDDADMCTVEHCDGAGACVFLERSDDPLCDNHFKCYKQYMGPRVDEDVMLIDQFKTSIATVTRPDRFCNPANKNNEGIDDPTAHMNCYRLQEEHFENIDVIVTNQFGEQKLTVRRVDSLCVPAIKDGIPSDLDINHYKCYSVLRARGQKRFEQREVTLEDQFEFKNTIVKRPKLLCNPVDKNGEPVPSPESHLVCYSITDAAGQDRFDRTPVEIEDQFNSGSAKAVRGDCREVSFMCVPSLKRHADATTTTTATSSTTTTTVATSAATSCGNGVIDGDFGETCETAADCGGSEACERCQCVGAGDVRVTLSWYGRNDLDLHVIDPAGEEIYYQNPAADSGGMLETNTTPACDGPDRMNVENVYWPAGTAPPGRYRVQVNYFGSCADDVRMPAFMVTRVVDGVETSHEGLAVFADPRCGPCMPASSCLCHPVVQFTR
jgi:hypothetical protein